MTRGLLPRPRFIEYLPGTLTWTSPLRVFVEPQWRDVVETFASDLRRSVDWEVQYVDDAESCDLEVRRLEELGDEEFQLAVSTRARIDASSVRGVAYALIVLRQLGPAALWSVTPLELDSLELPCVVLQDGPLFEWRGVHLDVSRHFFDVASVCRLIDQIAAHRMNRLHLHLNDDQGWRVEIPAWPRLVEVGSTRRSTPIGHESEGIDDNVVHAGYFSVGDIEIIRAHAERRCVTIVPEIDLPGHAQAVLAAYPELGNGGESLEVWTRWGISEHVLNVNEAALTFAEDVVLFVASLFPRSPVHIGGDECPSVEWERSTFARGVMDAHGFSDVRQLQGLFTQRMANVLQRAGHDVVAWDEVLDAEVPAGTVITAWRDSSKAVEAARRGFDVVMAPMQFLYFDWLSSLNDDEHVAVAPPPYATTWEKVYGFSVVPEGLNPDLRHHIRGAQAQLWTEYIDTRDHLDYMAFPRIAALAEVVWGTASSLDEFRPRLHEHLERLSAMGVTFRAVDDQ